MKERRPLVTSQNTGKDLTAVQSLQKKHQAVMVSTDITWLHIWKNDEIASQSNYNVEPFYCGNLGYLVKCPI